MKHIDHIGIAVENLEEAVRTYETLLDTACYKREEVIEQKVATAFFRNGETKVELLAATADDSVITKYIAKSGEGMHHIAFEVEDIRAEMKRLDAEGLTLLSDAPSKGADNKLVAFVHPQNNNGVLVELCQTIEEQS